MNLDLPTLMVMQSFALASCGAVLLFAWLQNQAASSLRTWGLGNVSAGLGIVFLMFGYALHRPIWSVLGGSLLSLQASLTWKAARDVDSRPAPIFLVLIGPLAAGLAGGVPLLRDLVGSLSLVTGAAYTLGGAATLWLNRQERLIARCPLIILMVVHAGSLLIGTYSTFNGSTGQDTVPPIVSLFGFIYFESIIFALGSSIFLLALIKERNEAASMAAARIDSLTGIANRAAFLADAARIVERCRLDGSPVSAMMLDLDRFKAVNDRNGHAVGDEVIRKFCEVSAAAMRPTDLFGRIGGEEFAVILAGSSIEATSMRAERIRAAFAESCRFVRGQPVNATVSCGVAASVGGDAYNLETLLERADMALYEAKIEGRNRIIRAKQSKPDSESSNVFRVA